jgi:hypothetical protein
MTSELGIHVGAESIPISLRLSSSTIRQCGTYIIHVLYVDFRLIDWRIS